MGTMERGLLMLSPLLMLLPVLRLRPIPGTDTTDTGHTAMDTTATDLMDMVTTMERGLLMLSPLLMLPSPEAEADPWYGYYGYGYRPYGYGYYGYRPYGYAYWG